MKIVYLIIMGLIALSINGCKWFPDTKIGKPKSVINITTDTVLNESTEGVEYHVRGVHLDLKGFRISGKGIGGNFQPVKVYDGGKVTNGIVSDSPTAGVYLMNGIPYDMLIAMKGMSRSDARRYADENLTPIGGGNMVVSGIRFEKVSKSVYVQSFVHNSFVRNSMLTGRKMAVYLDAGSHDNTVENNIIRDTGSVGIWGINKRESISIDASYNNRILNNTFSKVKGFTAIALYVNCGENNMPRPYDSNDNWIKGNTFPDRPVSIVVSSRRNIRGGLLHSCSGYDYPEVVERTVIEGNFNASVKDNTK